MNRFLLAVFFLAAALVPAVAQAQGRYEGLTEAERLIREGVKLEEEAVALEDNRPDDANELYEEALGKYEDAIESDADNVEGYVRLGYVLFALGRFDDGAARLEPALRLWPDNIPLRRAFATVLFAIPRRRAEAVGHLESIAKADPKQFDVFYLLGKFYYETGEYDAAAKSFRRYLSFRPEDIVVHGTLGNVYFKTGKFEPALAEFRLVLSLDPGNLAAQVNVANIRFKQGEYKVASALYEKLIASHPGNLGVLFNLASCRYQLGEFEAAQKRYGQFLEARPSHPTARYMAGMSSLALDRQGDARREFETLLSQHPRHARGHYRLALLDAAIGKLAAARDRLSMAEEYAPEDAWIAKALGDVYRELGELEPALESHTRAADLDPKVPDFQAAIGRDHFAAGALDEAVGRFTRARELDATRQDLTLLLAAGLLHRGATRVTAGELDAALSDATALDALGVRQADVELLRAAVALERGALQEAYDHALVATELAASAPCTQTDCPTRGAALARARVHLARAEYREAKEELDKLVPAGRAPSAAVANALGRAEGGLANWAAAMTWFVAARDLGSPVGEKNFAIASLRLVADLAAAGEHKQALEILEATEKLRPTLGAVHAVELDLAWSAVLGATGKYTPALAHLAEVRKAWATLSPENKARFGGGGLGLGLREAWLSYRLGRTDRAQSLTERLLKGGGRSDDVRKLLVAIYVTQASSSYNGGKTRKAKDYLKKASRLTRNDETVAHNAAVLDYASGKTRSGEKFQSLASRGRPLEAVYNYAIYLDDVRKDERGAFALYQKLAGKGGVGKDAKKALDVHKRVFGFGGK
jgi:tetratricopeptide (TPR) repeat protein